MARAYLKSRAEGAAPRTVSKREWLLSLVPSLHAKPIRKLAGPDIVTALKRIEADGRNETAHRAAMLVSRVFKYAVASGKCERNPAEGSTFALVPVQARKHPAITDPRRLHEFLASAEEYQSQGIVVRCALRLLPHVFLRSSELRCGTWSEIDFDAKVWRIPAVRMKGIGEAREPHDVPLSKHALAILEELYAATGPDPKALMFPSPVNRNRPISDMSLTRAMRLMGFTSDELVPHGFRSTASTIIRERGIASDACIERQLAHRRRGTQAHYDRSVLMKDRRRMMQAWSEYLDDLKSPAWLRLHPEH